MQNVEAVQLISKNEVLPMYQMREKFANKFTYGHSLIIGGSYGKIGSVHLACKAALVSGCGLVTAYIPECGYNVLQSSFPEAMVQTANAKKTLTEITPEGHFTVVGVGMGMGTSPATVTALTTFFKSNKLPLVIDADALNIISENKKLLKTLPELAILTPHKKELERLIGKWDNDFEMLKKVKVFSEENNCIVVVKDAITITVYKEEVFVNTSGNPALATAGAGDVLTGIITGLVAQGYEPLQAAKFGVYLHGRTADVALEEKGYQSFVASDAIENISKAYLEMFKQPEPITEEEQKI